MASAQASLTDRLLSEYASRLDSSLILAIAAEIDPTSKESEEEARSTLSALAEAAGAQGDLHEYDTALPEGHANANGTGNGTLSPDETSSSIDDRASIDTGASIKTGTATPSSSVTDEEAVEKAFKDWSLGEDAESDDLGTGIEDYKGRSVELSNVTSDPLSFLKTLFPKRERIELQLAFEDAGEDVEAAIETLLTEELLIREELEYETLLMQAEEEMNGETATGKKHRQRHRKPAKQTVSLTSTPRGVVSHHTDGSGDLRTPAEKPNVWVQTDSTILYLATLLSVPAGALASLFYQNSNSLPLTLSKIMDNAELTFDSLEDGELKAKEMKDLFPDKPNTTLRRCLCVTSGDINKAVELVRTLEDIYAREGTPLAHGLLLNASVADKAKNTALHKPAAGIPTAVLGKINGLNANGTFERPPSAQDCYILASTLRSKRDDAYRSAARTWQAKHALGNSGVAAYWAEHGRHLDRQAREWELRAARAVVDDRRKQARSLQTVDLHGLTVQQALTVTSECLTAWWASPSSPTTLTIITGAGKHSAGQNPVILPAVKKLLERERYDYRFEGERIHRGSLMVIGLQGRRKGGAY